MAEWKQGKCGWPTKAGGRCQRLTKKGTSRCFEHQGEWTAYATQRRKKAEQSKAIKRRKR